MEENSCSKLADFAISGCLKFGFLATIRITRPSRVTFTLWWRMSMKINSFFFHQRALLTSKSKIEFFDHNDATHLEQILEKQDSEDKKVGCKRPSLAWKYSFEIVTCMSLIVNAIVFIRPEPQGCQSVTEVPGCGGHLHKWWGPLQNRRLRSAQAQIQAEVFHWWVCVFWQLGQVWKGDTSTQEH